MSISRSMYNSRSSSMSWFRSWVEIVRVREREREREREEEGKRGVYRARGSR
jgi:hypothetical protein